MPAACRICHTVDGATVTPSFASSPWTRRYPHSGFSFARRTTRRAMPAAVGGRPGSRRLLVSYLLPTSLRCQASSVAGVLGRCQSSACGGEAVPARRTAPGRSAHIAPGRPAAAAPQPRAGAQSGRHSSPGRRGTPGQPGRECGTSADRQPPTAPGQPTITASGLLTTVQVNQLIEYSCSTTSCGHLARTPGLILAGTRPVPVRPGLPERAAWRRLPTCRNWPRILLKWPTPDSRLVLEQEIVGQELDIA
jgi:hypothetical protein